MQASGIGYWPVPVKVTASHCWYPHGCDDKKNKARKGYEFKITRVLSILKRTKLQDKRSNINHD